MCISVYLIQRIIFVYIPLQPKVLFDQPSIFGVKTYFYHWPIGRGTGCTTMDVLENKEKNTVEPPITAPPNSEQPLNNGQPSWHGLNLAYV